MKAFYLLLPAFISVSVSCFGQEDIQNRFAASMKEDLLDIEGRQKADVKSQFIVSVECGRNSMEVSRAKYYNHLHDSIARLKVESIIHTYGYPGPNVIGAQANRVMYNVIYNMPLAMSKKYVAILWQALKNGNTTPDDYAALADKVSMQESNGQIYDTITKMKGGVLYTPPILNPGGVDSLRRLIGLPPLQGNPHVK